MVQCLILSGIGPGAVVIRTSSVFSADSGSTMSVLSYCGATDRCRSAVSVYAWALATWFYPRRRIFTSVGKIFSKHMLELNSCYTAANKNLSSEHWICYGRICYGQTVQTSMTVIITPVFSTSLAVCLLRDNSKHTLKFRAVSQ